MAEEIKFPNNGTISFGVRDREVYRKTSYIISGALPRRKQLGRLFFDDYTPVRTMILLEDQGPVGGLVFGDTTSGTRELVVMAIAPEFRRAGRGSALLQYFEQFSRGVGVRRVETNLTHPEQEWFMKRGYNLLQRSYDAIRLGKDLS